MEQSISSILNGAMVWYLPSKGKMYWHRIDGPAVEYGYGQKLWYIDNRQLDIDEVEQWIKENNIDLTTAEDQMAFKLRFT